MKNRKMKELEEERGRDSEKVRERKWKSVWKWVKKWKSIKKYLRVKCLKKWKSVLLKYPQIDILVIQMLEINN